MIPTILAAVATGVAIALLTRSSSATTRTVSCRTDIVAHLIDKRQRVKPNLIVIHSTEGPTAMSAAGWFAHPDSQGSTHVVVGEDGCFQTLPDSVNAAGAGTVNPRALQIEFAGYAKWTREEWLARSRTLSSGRNIVQAWASEYGIPLRRLSRDELKAGKAGVATHADVSAVFGGTHYDPGSGFPIDRILS